MSHPAEFEPYPPFRSSQALAVFARLPAPGKVKTRLIPLLGRAGAAEFQEALIADAVRKISAVPGSKGMITPYFFWAHEAGHGGGVKEYEAKTPGIRKVRQKGADLGARLAHAFRHLWRDHRDVVVIGTDSPLMPRRVLRVAFCELNTCEAVLGPCPDGGYYLVGLRRPLRRPTRLAGAVFENVRWGSSFALRDTLENMLDQGLCCSMLEQVGDIDRPADFARLKQVILKRPSARRLAPATARFIAALGEA